MSVNEKAKKLTLDDLINAKIAKDKEKNKIIEVYIKSLGGNVSFVTPSTKRMKKMVYKSMSQKPDDLDESQVSLIYDCCPLVKSNYKKLMEAYEVKGAPTALIDELFNLDEQNEIILKLGGATDEELKKAHEEIKNS